MKFLNILWILLLFLLFACSDIPYTGPPTAIVDNIIHANNTYYSEDGVVVVQDGFDTYYIIKGKDGRDGADAVPLIPERVADGIVIHYGSQSVKLYDGADGMDAPLPRIERVEDGILLSSGNQHVRVYDGKDGADGRDGSIGPQGIAGRDGITTVIHEVKYEQLHQELKDAKPVNKQVIIAEAVHHADDTVTPIPVVQHQTEPSHVVHVVPKTKPKSNVHPHHDEMYHVDILPYRDGKPNDTTNTPDYIVICVYKRSEVLTTKCLDLAPGHGIELQGTAESVQEMFDGYYESRHKPNVRGDITPNKRLIFH